MGQGIYPRPTTVLLYIRYSSIVKNGAKLAQGASIAHRRLERLKSMARCCGIVISPFRKAVKIPHKLSKTSTTIVTIVPNMRGMIIVTLAISPFKRILLTS